MLHEKIDDRYLLVGELGQGGMGRVYRGEDTLLDRPVAVKVLSETGLGTEGRRRLLLEAQAAARLNHPNVVAVYDAGYEDGTPYLVMELVAGHSLYDAGELPFARLLEIGGDICRALVHAHEHGIIHRDLKPDNIFLTSDGQVKLMDFGLARIEAGTRLTQEGAIIGTFTYMAPELLLGEPASMQSDLYGLGVILYEAAAGRPPFTGENVAAVLYQHLHAPVIPPSTFNHSLPPDFDSLVLRLLAKQPADRPASAQEVLRTLLAIQRGAAEPALPAAREEVLLDRIVRGRLVGRNEEMAQLQAAWQRARAGQAQMVLLSGEPGVGKSRLAEELLVFAQVQGATVLRGGCYEYEATTPYMPFVEALRDWVHRQETEALREMVAAYAADLAQLAPEIEARLGPLPERPQLPPAELRSRLFDAVARFLGERAAARPLVLFIDDLHWADAGTIALAHYLARRLREAPALFLGAYRELELDRAHPLAAALVTWNRERLITRLMLGRLSLADCSRMLATLFGQDEVQDDFAAAIYRETEGNPFFVEEVVKALVEQGAVYRADGEWHRKSLEELAIPQSIKDAIGRRLEALTVEELAHLHTAAVLGKQFEFAELAEATGAEEALLDTLDRATAAQLLRVAGGERFAFTHDKIREVLYQELNPIRRRRIHQQVGGALERLYGDQIALHAADLAYHFTESADLERALRYALHAAKWALSLPAFDEAVRYYEHAREIAESLGQVETLYQVDTALGDTYFTSGHYDAAVQAFERALDRAPAGQEALARVKLGAVYAYLGREGSDRYLEETLAALDPETQPAAYAEANAYIGRYHHYQGRPRTALTFLHRAKEYAEAAGDPALIANTYVFLAGAHAQLSERVESSLWARRAIEFGREHGLPRFEAAGHEFLSETLLTRGLWRDALREAKRDNEIAHSIGSQTGILWSQFCRAWALWELGDLAEAQALAAKTVVQSEDAGDLRLAAFVRYIWSGIELALGNMEASEDSARRVLEASQHWQRVLLRGLGGKAMADVLLARGESGEAIAVLEGGLPPPEAETRAGLPPTYDGLAQAYLQHGDLATAEHYAEALQAFATETGSPQNLMLARLSLARIASRRGDADAAAASFAAAIGGFEELESRPDLARALHFRAQFHQAQGDATAAVEDLQAALALASEMGMSRLERQVQAALAAL